MEKALTVKQKRVMVYFIEAAEQLIRTEGFEHLSIRKIAAKAGYNSATLYNYFEDLEHLVTFASVFYLREYVNDISKHVTDALSPYDQFRKVYEIFNYYCFRAPEIFYNMFFGKYRSRLPEVISQYYDLFPGELEGTTKAVRQMLSEGDIYLRDRAMMNQLVDCGYIKEEKASMTLTLLIRTYQSYIYDVWMQGDKVDPAACSKEFLQIFDYILATGKE